MSGEEKIYNLIFFTTLSYYTLPC